jgi:hypothetical protein
MKMIKIKSEAFSCRQSKGTLSHPIIRAAMAKSAAVVPSFTSSPRILQLHISCFKYFQSRVSRYSHILPLLCCSHVMTKQKTSANLSGFVINTNRRRKESHTVQYSFKFEIEEGIGRHAVSLLIRDSHSFMISLFLYIPLGYYYYTLL